MPPRVHVLCCAHRARTAACMPNTPFDCLSNLRCTQIIYIYLDNLGYLATPWGPVPAASAGAQRVPCIVAAVHHPPVRGGIERRALLDVG